jgi:site-specific DNA-methyltransferase (adenine-specific)
MLIEPNNIYHGDCLELIASVPDKSVDLIITDPPYKMTKNGKSCRPNYMPASSSENLFDGKLPDTYAWMSECFRVLKDDTHFYTFANINSIQDYLNQSQKACFKLHNIISMIKDTKMPNRWYLKYTEFVLFFRKGAAKPINDMTSRDYEFVKTPTAKSGKLHVTEKPYDFIEKLVTNSSDEGDLILDPFAGSATICSAAKNTNRRFIGIEKDQDSFDTAKKRIINNNG